MINRMTAENRFVDQIEETVENTSTVKEAIEELLSLLGRYIRDHVNSLGKVQFELTVLVTNHPEKAESIVSKPDGAGIRPIFDGDLVSADSKWG